MPVVDLAARHPAGDEAQCRAAQRPVACDLAAPVGAQVQHLADQFAVAGSGFEVAAEAGEQFPELIRDGAFRIRGRIDRVRELVGPPFGDGLVEMLAGFEVIEEGPRRDIGVLADLFELRLANAAGLEEFERAVDQPFAVLLPTAFEAVLRRADGDFFHRENLGIISLNCNIAVARKWLDSKKNSIYLSGT